MQAPSIAILRLTNTVRRYKLTALSEVERMRVNYEGVEIASLGAGRITPDPEWNIAPHKHDHYEMHFITEGIGRNLLDNGEIELYPGIVYMAPPHEVHAQYSDRTSPLGLYFIVFD